MTRILQTLVLILSIVLLSACGGGQTDEEQGFASSGNNPPDNTGNNPGGGNGGGGGNNGGGGSEEDNPGAGHPHPTPPAQPPANGNASASVSWSIPNTRQSGAALAMSEIGGYKIYYGTSSTNLNQSIDVPDAYQTTFTITNLVQGNTYFIRITAYDTNNVESQRSNLVSKTAS